MASNNPFAPEYANIRNKINYYANKYGIDANIFLWQLWQENRFRSNGCSGANACGIAQFIPATAARFNVNRNDIDSSLDGAARYMQWLLRQPYINGNYALALAGYNAGEGRVKQYKGIPPFKETQNYVATILRNAGKNTTSYSNDNTNIATPVNTFSINNLSTNEKVMLGVAGVLLLYILL